MPDRLRTESIKKSLEDKTFKDLMTVYEAGLIDEEKFIELMHEVDTIQYMTFEELHQLFDLMRGENRGR